MYKGLLSSYTHNSVPYTTAAVKDCPLQSSIRADYRYLSPWYGVQNTPVGQRVNTSGQYLQNLVNTTFPLFLLILVRISRTYSIVSM